MKNFLTLLTGVAMTGILFSGCEAVDEPFNANDTEVNSISSEIPLNKQSETSAQPLVVGPLEDYVSQRINAYDVKLLKRETKGIAPNITTTFSYVVSGTGQTPGMDSFSLEIPGCTEGLLSWTPTESAKVVDGVLKWNSSVTKDESREYSMTYKGDVQFGVVNSTVTRGSNVDSKRVLGPCKDVFTLNGNNYIDSNDSKTKQASESGISSFVNLYDEGTNKEFKISTLSNGFYSVMVLKGGYYDISVDSDLMGDGNYTLVTDQKINIDNVQQNFSNQNFGFDANSSKMINDLANGQIKVNTQPTKFWIDQIRHAGKKNSNFTIEQMNTLLIKVEGLFLDEPFKFGANKLDGALGILTRPIKTDLDFFLQQLLTAELNIASDRGAYFINEQNQAVQLKEFNDALLIFAEAIACFEMNICSQADNLSSEAITTKAVRSADSNLLFSFNGSGGVN